MINIHTPTSNLHSETEQRFRRLWLVRHGATLWNNQQRYCGHSDIPLAPQGRTQARWLASHLRTHHIAKIYSSDLLRAHQTAQVIAAQSQQPVQIALDPAWRELAFGTWEGLTYQQIAQQGTPDFFTDPLHVSPPGGESLPHLVQRVQRAFIALSHAMTGVSAPKGDIVLVSHGGTLRVLLCSILGISLEQLWQLRIDHGSLSAIDFLPTLDQTLPLATLALLNVQRPLRTRSIPLTASPKISSAETVNDGPATHIGGTMRHV